MAMKKNKKRIDPRYFLSETTYRDLDEAPDVTSTARHVPAERPEGYQSQHAAGWPGEWFELVKAATGLLGKLAGVGAGTGVDISGGELTHDPLKAAAIPASLDAEVPNLFAQVQEFLPKLIQLSKTPMGPHKQLSPALQAAASALQSGLSRPTHFYEALKKANDPGLNPKSLTHQAVQFEKGIEKAIAQVSALIQREEAGEWQQGFQR